MNRDEIIAEIKSQLMAELDGYKSQLQSSVSPETREKVKQVLDEGSEYIKENPWTSVALAAAAGFVLGRLLYRQGDE